MNSLKYIRSLVFIMLAFLSSSALAITYTCSQFGKTFTAPVPSTYFGGFNVIKSSCQTLVNNHWGNFGMEGKYWGWGYYNACSTNTALNRTLRALELLKVSKNPWISDKYFLNQAYDLSKKSINHLRMKCAVNQYDNAVAFHERAWWSSREIGSGTVNLYQNIFKRSIVEMAIIIMHEARHKEKPHNGGRYCPRRGSCDTSLGYDGANAYEFKYAWWYGDLSHNSTRYTRQMALDFARETKNTAFVFIPDINVNKLAK